ncbi:4'-phosphopantetheinyl transferase superfamily protein [Gramella jeungdoensis]|uniref:4'-phosphopantetheinyl transferase superfamily protein n=1 Tax=Gramella jeungdoensis TaxID=708091 RepID=A0ABT0Z2Y4_9FLAO|nr:4'-phosphopantetheinyl transferase superfamily protein [Gramella jeungdoensis]
MIGNDIIDVRLILSERKSENQRFMAKVFTEEERSMIEKADDPETSLWLFWSIKEAAYKAHQRNFDLSRTLNPFSFKCKLKASGKEGTVEVDGFTYDVQLELNSEYIHCHTSSQTVFKKIYRKYKPTKEEILKEICTSLDLKSRNFRIEKDSNGIPSLVDPHTTKKLPFSLSHHGNFTAFVIPLINS